jgi:D-3-phosphoglycerate dehydrogenase
MYKVRTYNQISSKGLDRFSRSKYEVASEISSPDAILLRSQKLHDVQFPKSLLAIARAGAGVNNIPVERCTEEGVVVFNTPGANANAVKELVIAALLLSSRGIVEGISHVLKMDAGVDSGAFAKQLEKDKALFAGNEIAGKTLGVVGLGAIGSLVANTALELGMHVVGYDPAISVDAAWRLSSKVQKMDNLQSLMGKSDFVTLHVPAMDATRHMINADALKAAKKGLCLLNFAREEVVDTDAAISALKSGALAKYTTDFPTPELTKLANVILMPHIGASTEEAEENCAVMAADQLMDFIENGNIVNSVNFPVTSMERAGGHRITFCNRNVPGVLGHVLPVLAERNINVIDMLNKSRGDIAYNVMDLDAKPGEDLLQAIRAIEHVINVRAVG